MQRCSFCNNSILDFESPIAEGPRVYHKKCHTTAVGSRETISQGNETRLKHEEAFKMQPKIIGEVVIDEGDGGFVVDPVTVRSRFPPPHVGHP